MSMPMRPRNELMTTQSSPHGPLIAYEFTCDAQACNLVRDCHVCQFAPVGPSLHYGSSRFAEVIYDVPRSRNCHNAPLSRFGLFRPTRGLCCQQRCRFLDSLLGATSINLQFRGRRLLPE